MAIKIIDLVLRGMHGMDPNAKLVAVVLADQTRGISEGICWPGISLIANLAGMSRRQVTDRLAELRDAGWLDVVANPKGGRAPTKYRLNIRRLRESAEQSTVQDAAQSAAQHGAQSGAQNDLMQPRKTDGQPRKNEGSTAQHVAHEPLNRSNSTDFNHARAPETQSHYSVIETKEAAGTLFIEKGNGEPATHRRSGAELTLDEQQRRQQ
jgi:hypothetical protein